MSGRLFQGVIHEMKDAVDRTIGVLDEAGTVIACTNLAMMGTSRDEVSVNVNQGFEKLVQSGYTYKPFGTKTHLDFIVFVEGEDELALTFANMIGVSLNSVKQYYDEKYEKSTFVKNIILDNVLFDDIYVKSKELHFQNDTSRVVFLIRTIDSTDFSVFDIISNLFPNRNRDFVVNINENDIVLVNEVKSTATLKDFEKTARTIVNTLHGELFVKSIVGIGTMVTDLKDLARSFKEAEIALEVGKIFDEEKLIISYENLGIGRLIYQLPTTLCEMFLQEVLKKGSLESLDNETLFTIQKFFENNLNVSETSRKLFVHRNTLVYRIEKIRKITGLDLREFDHAIIFKVALMVKKYLTSNPTKF
ncbi:MAG: helix-turn-helix domain-containing protein [Clostridia bacterium]|nr:helix-turn-helix domain-containing protein [Clostridia bacterium]